MKNSMRRAMISTVCMLIVAVMSLTGVTYAWFTAGSDATVDNIIVNVQAATGGIELSGDNGVTWQTKISAGNSAVFTPVSTVGKFGDDSTIMKFFTGEINPENSAQIKTTAIEANTDPGYFRKDLHIKNISGSDIKIDLAEFEIEGEGSNNANYAMRVALVVWNKYTMEGISEDNPTGTKTPVENFATTVKIYEPYAEQHTANAVKNLGAVNGTAHTYLGIKSASNGFVALNDNSIAAALASDVLTYNASDLTITLANGEYAEISIYVWIEGQDIDCENSISAGAFTFDFVFVKDASYNGN